MITPDQLLAAADDHALDGGLRIQTTLEPLGGTGTPTKPAIYEGGQYQHQVRWVGHGDDRQKVDAIVIDNEPSQANRMELALERLAHAAGLPRVSLDLTETEPLPPHLPRRLSGYRWPHRHADAYLRDSMLDGTPFPKTDLGKRIYQATAENPEALLEWFPQSLLYGFWQSHLGTGAGASRAKLARSWRSSIVGLKPGLPEGDRPVSQLGLKGDPYNLTLGKDGKVHHDADNEADWQIAEGGRGPKDRETVKLSEIGHGQVLVGSGPAAVSFARIEQVATLSMPDLRRVWVEPGAKNAAARALLAAIGLLGHVGAFGRPFTLRSDADLRPTAVTWTWLGAEVDEDIDPLTEKQAIDLVKEVAAHAQQVGLPVGTSWPADELVLTPVPGLQDVIRKTYPEAE